MTRRVILSCDLCRLRKIKCDKMIPCQNCVKRNVHCSWTEAEDFRRLFPRRAASAPLPLPAPPREPIASTSALSPLQISPTTLDVDDDLTSEQRIRQLQTIVGVFGRALGLSTAQLSDTTQLAEVAARLLEEERGRPDRSPLATTTPASAITPGAAEELRAITYGPATASPMPLEEFPFLFDQSHAVSDDAAATLTPSEWTPASEPSSLPSEVVEQFMASHWPVPELHGAETAADTRPARRDRSPSAEEG